MKKYLVDVYLPAVGKHYDVYLPCGKRIGEITPLLVSLAESLSDGGYQGTTDAVLLSAADGEPYDCNITVFDAGIRNSSRLILI